VEITITDNKLKLSKNLNHLSACSYGFRNLITGQCQCPKNYEIVNNQCHCNTTFGDANICLPRSCPDSTDYFPPFFGDVRNNVVNNQNNATIAKQLINQLAMKYGNGESDLVELCEYLYNFTAIYYTCIFGNSCNFNQANTGNFYI
jgi:hypothetical protein